MNLGRFERRVRALRAWRGLAIGICAGGLLSTAWAALDVFGIWFTDWMQLCVLTVSLGVVGLLVGGLLKVPSKALAASIDRRAHLEDRLATALERQETAGVFDEALRQDAGQHIRDVQPAAVFPVRLGRWQAGALALTVLAASVFLLGNSSFLLSDQQKKSRAELQKAADQIERVLKPYEQPETQKDLTAEEKALADELKKFQRELRKGRVDKAQAMQKANELSKEAEKLMNQRAKQLSQNLHEAQSAFEKAQQDQLRKAGLDKLDPMLMKLTPQERSAAMQSLQKQMQKLQDQLKDPNLSAQQKSELQKKLEQTKQDLQQLKLSEEAHKTLQKMANDPAFKEIQQLMQKLAQASSDAQQGKQTKLSPEEMAKLKQQIEDQMKKLKDPGAMKDFLEALKRALKEGKLASQNGAAIMPGFKIPNFGKGGIGKDEMFMNAGFVNKSDKEQAGQGKTETTMIMGDRQTKGDETYMEIKGPTTLGTRTSIPYQQVLPNYKHRAEQAIDRQQIPKEHQKRVKQYFDSLQGGK